MAIDLSSLSGNLTGNRVRTTGQTTSKDDASKSNEAQAQNTQGKSTADSVHVKLSDEALRLNSRAQSASDINESKVSSVKAAIEDGSYQIDYQALAEDIIRFEGEL